MKAKPKRRATRNVKKSVPRKVHAAAVEVLKSIASQVDTGDWKVVSDGQPGRGQVVGAQPGNEGKPPVLALTDDRIADVLKAAKAGDDRGVGIILRSIAQGGMDEGRRACGEANTRWNKMKELQDHRRIVQEFLNELMLARKLQDDLRNWLISNHQLEHIERALRDAGWSPNRAPE
jgi:hypothetical protein